MLNPYGSSLLEPESIVQIQESFGLQADTLQFGEVNV